MQGLTTHQPISEVRQLADAILKRCSKCGLEKPHSEYNKHSGSRDGLRGYCKACHCKYSTNWISQNREHYNARIRADRARNPEKYREWTKNYREADPEHYARIKKSWLDQNKQKRREAIRRYTLKYAAELHQKVRARQAWKIMALPSWADRAAMAEFYKCAKVRTRLTGIPHEVDHIVPLKGATVCGLHCESNLQILPKLENLRKLNRHWPDMWT